MEIANGIEFNFYTSKKYFSNQSVKNYNKYNFKIIIIKINKFIIYNFLLLDNNLKSFYIVIVRALTILSSQKLSTIDRIIKLFNG